MQPLRDVTWATCCLKRKSLSISQSWELSTPRIHLPWNTSVSIFLSSSIEEDFDCYYILHLYRSTFQLVSNCNCSQDYRLFFFFLVRWWCTWCKNESVMQQKIKRRRQLELIRPKRKSSERTKKIPIIFGNIGKAQRGGRTRNLEIVYRMCNS
jgi:hypothetical protein